MPVPPNAKPAAFAADFPRRLRAASRVGVWQPRPGLGDMIWHLPHLRALAAATASGRVTLITKRSTQADRLLEGDPAIERFVWIERNPREGRGRHDGVFGFPRLVSDLRACRLDLCVLLHHGASLAAALRLAGIVRVAGYGAGWQRAWLTDAPPPGATSASIQAFDQATAFLEAAGLRALAEPMVAVTAAARTAVHADLTGLPRPLAVLGIGSHGAARQWGAARFAALAEALLASGTGTVLLLGAANEATIAQQIMQALPDRPEVRPVLGWPIAEVAALLAEAALFVGNDSGPMNLRAAVGGIAYGLFGASAPLQHSGLIRPILPAEGALAGMDRIGVGQVMAAVLHSQKKREGQGSALDPLGP